MTDIISRLEASPEGSRGLSNDVARAFGWFNRGNSKRGEWFAPKDMRDGKPVLCSLHGTDVWPTPPDFTRSIDAALTLVPKGLDQWSINVSGHICQALIYRPGDGVVGRGDASTSALALCIAALKARESDAR